MSAIRYEPFSVVNYRGIRLPADNLLGHATLLVVLVAGGLGTDYAAYQGIVTSDVITDAQTDWVSRHGDKLRFEQAQLHFEVDTEHYRR